MQSTYTPVSCQFQDSLELLAMRRQLCAITYYDTNGVQQQAIGVISDLFAKDGADYLRLDQGDDTQLILRLDQIISAQAQAS